MHGYGIAERLRTLSDDVLPGITRAWVLAAAAELGIRASAESLEPDRVRQADERFLCGTGIEFAPIHTVDSTPAAAWPDRPVLDRLVEHYFRQARGELPVTETTWAAE